MITRLVRYVNRITRNYLVRVDGVSSVNKQRNKDRAINVNGMKITEHAIIRYFERVEGYDIQKIRQEISYGLIGKGSGKHIVGNLVVVTEGRHIITVYPNDNRLQNQIKGLEKLHV